MTGAQIVSEIISILVSGITEFGQGIGQGLGDLVKAIFFTTAEGGTESISVFGVLIVVFAGISLAIGLSRWVLNFLTSLGGKNS